MTRLLTFALGLTAVLAASGPTGAAAEGEPKGEPVVIFAFGDSLTSGYGLPAKDAFPVKLQAALRSKGYNVEIVNGGVAGDTTKSGATRLDWSVPKHADAAIVEFGANDAFQGVPPATTRKNLESIVERLQARGMEVMIAGMKAPRNLGPAYYDDFDAMFEAVASQYKCILYPFYLDGVVTDSQLNQADRIHPNAAGVDVIVGRIEPTVEQLIDRVMTERKLHRLHTAD